MSNKNTHAYHNPDLSQSIEERVKAVAYSLTQDVNYNGWDTEVLKEVRFVSAVPGKVEFEMTVTPAMCNKGNNLHGGCSTTLLDNLSSTTFLTIAKEGFMDAGTVSRTITMTFLRPVPAGTKVRIICEAISAGKRLANCKAQIETLDGKVCVTCIHDKAIVPRQKL
ncbi:hypothetical protein H2198_003302 [Neophaeococcomyces mojaviensis]|uniref:Uncharacterized protein n=1 Tax=Neophaeococcomyces mojaviensis TaxID=3383035 RepID=A0ACC3AC87_9EURO|nr:hypothetical protein H2198_003302 [Knufia sp. JES_112]